MSSNNESASRLRESTIIKIENLGRFWRRFSLSIDSDDFNFLEGQWIDFSVPSLNTKQMGGYSIVSSQSESKKQKQIQIIVKFDPNILPHHSITKWLHEEAKETNKVQISAGQGTFFFSEKEFQILPKTIVLIGAGSGITPLLGLFKQFNEKSPKIKTHFLYSSNSEDEIELCKMELIESIESLHLHNSKEKGRMNDTLLKDIFNNLLKTKDSNSTTLFFLCGPRGFIEFISNFLTLELKIPKEQVKFELWW